MSMPPFPPPPWVLHCLPPLLPAPPSPFATVDLQVMLAEALGVTSAGAPSTQHFEQVLQAAGWNVDHSSLGVGPFTVQVAKEE